MAVGNFSLPITSGVGNLTPAPYVRPADWLEIDSLVSVGQQKLVALVAVFEEGNFFAVTCNGAYTVDWGDGTVTNYASSSNAYYQFNYANFAGTECSRGYRQAIITITPQSGQNLTILNFAIGHNQAGLTTGVINGLLDVKLSAPNLTSLSFANKNRMLEQVDFVGTNSITSFNLCFNACNNLIKIKNLWTNSCTNFTSIFNGCYKLEHLPNINTSSGTNFTSSFYQCYSLKSLPSNIDFSNATTLFQTFFSCYSIVEFPTINAPLCTSFQATFQNCYGIIKNPKIITSPTLTKNFASIFQGCVSLKTFEYNTDFWTKQSSSYASMFSGCTSLETIPDSIDTSGTITVTGNNSMFLSCVSLEKAPMMDLSKSQNIQSIFNGCASLKTVPSYTLGTAAQTGLNSAFTNCFLLTEIGTWTFTQNILNTAGTFQGCASLVKAPDWNLSFATSVATMFSGCTNLASIPEYNLAGVTSVTTNMFLNCYQLQKGKTTGLRYTITYQNCKLSRTALVDIFNGLGTAVGTQSITITSNYGAASLTAGERAIATGKGWTIVG